MSNLQNEGTYRKKNTKLPPKIHGYHNLANVSKLKNLRLFFITEMNKIKKDGVQRYLRSLLCGSKLMVKLSISLFNNSWAIIIISKCITKPPKIVQFCIIFFNSHEKIRWQIFNMAYSAVQKYWNGSIVLLNFSYSIVLYRCQ